MALAYNNLLSQMHIAKSCFKKTNVKGQTAILIYLTNFPINAPKP